MSYAAQFARTARRHVKVALAGGLIAAALVARRRQQRKDDLSVVMYHGVLPRVRGPAAYGDLFVSTRDFVRHLHHLKSRYHPLSLEQVLDVLRSNTGFPPRAVAVTFDDGYENTMKVALPLLAEARMPATVFVPPALMGRAPYLWFDNVRLLVQRAWEARRSFDLGSGVRVLSVPAGAQESHFLSLNVQILDLPLESRRPVLAEIERAIEHEGLGGRFPEFALTTWATMREAVAGGFLSIGSHALAHGDLSAMSLEEQRADLLESRQRIERELGRPCVSLAYPFGRWNGDTLAAARDAGYQCAFTVEHGFNRAGDDAFRLKRIMAGDKGHTSILAARLSGGFPDARNRNAL